jgi:hypothetical protein
MLTSIDLDHQPCFAAGKIDDKWADFRLTPK